MSNLNKVRSGDPLVIPAPAYNAFIDAAQDFRARTANLGQQATPVSRSSGIVMVKNESGTDRARFDVLGLGEPLFLPDGPASAERSFMNAVALQNLDPPGPTGEHREEVRARPTKQRHRDRRLAGRVLDHRDAVGQELELIFG